MAENAEARLGDFLSLQRGTTYKSSLLGDSGPVLLGLASIQRNGGFRSDALKTYGGDSPNKLLLRPGDMYVSLKDVTQSADLLGAVARVPSSVQVGRVTQDTVKLIFDKMEIRQSYIYWLLRTPQYRKYCHSHSNGTTNLSLSREDFLAYPVPSLTPDRAALVDLLEVMEAKVVVNERIAQSCLALARSLYEEAACGAGEEVELGKVVTLKYGKALREPDRRPGPIPVFGCTGQVGWHDLGLTAQAGPVVGRKGANAGWVSWSSQSCWVIDTAFFVDISCEYLTPEVAYLMLEAARLSGLVGDSAVPGLNRDAAHNHLVRLPNQAAALELSNRVKPLMLRSTQSQYESRQLATLRDTLLPQLMSGKLRVRDAEKIVEDAV
ncbi:hypothetical protein [Streptomyces regalis]|uniref:hypothetical protein n=1 Tax=Streptomyces regalis TaxID=68262 RepID=UPI000B284370|nr:hypothetical protein [Streptomyces regalis]